MEVWGTEKVSSLTFAGTQNSNMSDRGAKVLAQDIAGMEVKEYAKKYTPLKEKLYVRLSSPARAT